MIFNDAGKVVEFDPFKPLEFDGFRKPMGILPFGYASKGKRTSKQLHRPFGKVEWFWICQFQSLGNLDWISFNPFRRLGRGNQFFARPSDSSGLANGFLQAVPTPRDWQMDFCKAFRRLGNHDQIFFLQFRHLGKGEWVFVWHSDASGKTNGFLQAIPTHREGQIEFVLPSPRWFQTRAYLK